MQCNDVLLLISELNRGELGANQSQALRAHINGCASCAQEAALDQKLSRLLLQNAPDAPQDMGFAMMQDRVWAQLQGQPKKRSSWFALFGLAASALVALFLLWPSAAPKGSNKGLPMLTNDELAVVDELSTESPLSSLFAPFDLEGLDDEGAAMLSQKIATALPAQDMPDTPSQDDGSYLDELDSLSPEELEALEKLIDMKKKG